MRFDVRDMLEHFDLYLAGKGNLQGDDSEPWSVLFSSDEPNGGERKVHVGRFSIDVSSAAAARGLLARTALRTGRAGAS